LDVVQIQLSETEAVVLREILASYLSDLRMEIADTDSMDFREGLKKKEVFLKWLLHELEIRGAGETQGNDPV
jgi:hypothetical protein